MMEHIKQVGGRAAMGASALGTMFVLGVMLAGPSSAASDPVADAFTTMEGKVTTYGGAIVSLVIVAVGIFLGIRYLRKGVNSA